MHKHGKGEGRKLSMKKLKVAVIGCGKISSMHLEAIGALDMAELMAVCDIREERAKEAAAKYGGKAYTDYKEMFVREKLDAIHICLPHYLHTVVAMEAFKHGIHVLSEKPMSIRYEDAVQAVELAEECGVQYGVIFQCRYNTPSIHIKKRIADGRLGKVQCARVVLTWNRPDKYYSGSDWKGTWDKEGGGVIINQTIHSIDLANWFIDSEPVEVVAALTNRTHKAVEVEDTAEGMIRYKNGSQMMFYASNNYPCNEPIEIRLVCENGKAVFSYGHAELTYNDGTVERVTNQPQKIVTYTSGKEYWGYQHAVQINQFYQAVLGKEELEISGREALKIQKIICDIYANRKI